ncbi:MAG: 2-amino-4-hydroxy-6-hydroxymethyldihydropteridine diphosphokinase [Betaproteobacteria bacterium]|nr:2-amino-4-hydroxy-6-hydroxymethyldihydropteridine diphosphokinase [Betaproteobacteria bacterium]
MNPDTAAEQHVFLGLGSNLGQPETHVLRAFDGLARMPGSRLLRRSSLYRTAPVGFVDQPHFVNAVAEMRTVLSPEALLVAILALERDHGRVRSFANAPRTLDIDILLFGGLVRHTDRLTLPHPRAHLREFVLRPLAEIAPDCDFPGRGPVWELLAACEPQGVTRLGGVADAGTQASARMRSASLTQ